MIQVMYREVLGPVISSVSFLHLTKFSLLNLLYLSVLHFVSKIFLKIYFNCLSIFPSTFLNEPCADEQNYWEYHFSGHDSPHHNAHNYVRNILSYSHRIFTVYCNMLRVYQILTKAAYCLT